MVVFNRILSILTLLLAIAACFGAYLLNERRVEMRDRADKLSATLVNVVKNLEGVAGDPAWSGTSNQKAVTKESTGWQSYHAATVAGSKAFTEPLANSETLASDAITHKTKLTDYILELSKIMETQNLADDATFQYNNFSGNHAEYTATIANHMKAMRERENALITAVVTAAQNINKPINRDEIADIKNVKTPDRYKAPLNDLNTNCTSLYERCTFLATNMKSAVEKITLMPLKANASSFLSEDKGMYEEAMNLFVQEDMPALNNKLDELAKTIARKNELEAENIDLRAQVEARGKEISNLKNTLGEREATIVRLNKELDLYRKDKDRPLSPNFIASVVEVDTRFDFVVLDKGEEQEAVVNGQVLLHNGKDYICKARITRVLKDKCIAEILPLTRQGTPAIGATAIPAN